MKYLVLLALLQSGLALGDSGKCYGLFNSSITYYADALTTKPDLTLLQINAQDLYVSRPDPLRRNKYQENPDPAANKEKPAEKVQKLIRLLQELKPDIVSINEVIGKESVRALDPKGEYFYFNDTPADVRGNQIAFLVRKTLNVDVQLVVPEIKQQHILSRGLPYLLLRQKNHEGKANRGDPPDLIVVGLHLKPFRKDDGEAKFSSIKKREIKELIDLVTNLQKQYPESPLVVTGDFNADLNTRPELLPLKQILRDTLDYGVDAQSRSQRTTHTYHAGKYVEAGQLDAFLVNEKLLSTMVQSYVYRYKDHNGKPKKYIDSAGNEVPYPTSIEAREQNISDHNPVVSVFNLQNKSGVIPNPVDPQQSILRKIYEVVDTHFNKQWSQNDQLTFDLNVRTDLAEFVVWLKERDIDSYIYVKSMDGGRIRVNASYEGLGYLLLESGAYPRPLVKEVHFVSPQAH